MENEGIIDSNKGSKEVGMSAVAGGLIAGIIIAVLISLGLIVWQFINYKSIAIESCTKVGKDASDLFQPVTCSGIGSVDSKMFKYVIILASLVFVSAFIMGIIEKGDFFNSSLSSLLAVAVFIFPIAGITFILSDYGDNIANERNAPALIEWSQDRYGVKLSDEGADKLLSNKLRETRSIGEYSKVLETEDGKPIVLREDSENKYKLMDTKTLAELPLKKDSENSKIKK